MNRTKLIPKFMVFIVVGILAFSFISTVQAGVPPFMEDRDPDQRIFWLKDSEISASKESWFYCGVGYIPEEIEENWFPKNPYKIRLYIDGEEIDLDRYAYHDKNREFRIPYKDNEGIWQYDAPLTTTDFRVWNWYYIFEPGYFTPSETPYKIRVEIWVYGCYGGSEKKGWRIFENKIGPPGTPKLWWYGPEGFEWIFTKDLKVNG